MILGFISRGSMALILHHILENHQALGVGKWDDPTHPPLYLLQNLTRLELWMNNELRLKDGTSSSSSP